MSKNRFTSKAAALVTAAIMVLSMAACGAGEDQKAESQTETAATESTVQETTEQTTESTAPETETEAAAGIANPFSEFETLGEASSAAGVEIEIPEGPEGYRVTCYRAIRDTGLLEIVYLNGPASSEDTQEAYRIRKAEGDEDISGDFNDYSQVIETEADGKTVTLKGEEDRIFCATWTDGGYSYAIDIDMGGDGMSQDEVLALAAAIH